jgi:hypothetical protein
MRKAVYLALFFSFIAAAFSAQSFDGIYMKNYEVRGGAKLKGAHTYLFNGTIVRDDSVTLGFKVAYKSDSAKFVIKYVIDQDTMTIGYNAAKAWTFAPELSSGIIEIPEKSVKEAYNLNIKPIIEFCAILDYYKNEKYKFKVTENEMLDSVPQIKLQCEKDQNSDIVYIDPNTFLVSKIFKTITIGERMLPVGISLNDYRKIGDLMFPFEVSTMDGLNRVNYIKLENMEIDLPLPDDLFDGR